MPEGRKSQGSETMTQGQLKAADVNVPESVQFKSALTKPTRTSVWDACPLDDRLLE